MTSRPDSGGPANPTRLGELVRFAVVGSGSTLLYLGMYALLVTVGTSYVLAAVVSFIASAGFGFLLHHRWTFRTRQESWPGLARWLALQGSVLIANIAALAVLVAVLGVDRLLAQTLLLPAIALTTFVLSRRIVFRRPAPRDPRST
jgi:putative flippase GtrA